GRGARLQLRRAFLSALTDLRGSGWCAHSTRKGPMPTIGSLTDPYLGEEAGVVAGPQPAEAGGGIGAEDHGLARLEWSAGEHVVDPFGEGGALGLGQILEEAAGRARRRVERQPDVLEPGGGEDCLALRPRMRVEVADQDHRARVACRGRRG